MISPNKIINGDRKTSTGIMISDNADNIGRRPKNIDMQNEKYPNNPKLLVYTIG